MNTNAQKPQRIERDREGRVTVHSMFHTIQGEGPFAGESAFFIRLHGCNLQCPGCDTDYTSQKAYMLASEVADVAIAMGRNAGDLVVITGGEPFRQNIEPLVWQLLWSGFTVQIETNGTLYLPDIDDDPANGFPYDDVTIVCSPKTPTIHPKLAEKVTAYKYVLSAGFVDPDDGLPTVALAHDLGARVARPPEGWEGTIYLQPMDVKDDDANRDNVLACVESVMKYRRYTLGFQMHKYIDLP